VCRGVEATLRSKLDIFKKSRECLNDDLSQVLIAQEEAEASKRL